MVQLSGAQVSLIGSKKPGPKSRKNYIILQYLISCVTLVSLPQFPGEFEFAGGLNFKEKWKDEILQ